MAGCCSWARLYGLFYMQWWQSRGKDKKQGEGDMCNDDEYEAMALLFLGAVVLVIGGLLLLPLIWWNSNWFLVPGAIFVGAGLISLAGGFYYGWWK